jgi:SAM-dependent methyltransferase
MSTEYTLALDAEAINRLNTMAAAARPFEAPAWTEAGIVEGASVLDAGCGPGAFLAEFASLVGRSGSALGIDSSEETIDAGSAYLAHHDLPQASVRLADVFNSELEAASFDVTHARLLLIHVGHRALELLKTLRDLVRPGGHLVLTDVDGPSCGLSETIPELEELMAAWVQMMRGRGNDVRIGLHLPALAVAAGLEIVSFRGAMTIIPPGIRFRLPHWEAHEAILADKIATEDDVLRWERAITSLTTAGTAYFSFPTYTLVARRPR